MLIYHIDPAYLAAPSYPECANSAQQHIENVIELGRLVREALGLRVTCSSVILEQLSVIGSFPMRNALRDMLDVYGLIGVFSVEDLVKLYNRLLDMAQPLTDVSAMAETELISCVLLPDPFHKLSPSDLATFSRVSAGQVGAIGVIEQGAQAVYGSSISAPSAAGMCVGVTLTDRVSLGAVPVSGSFSVKRTILAENRPADFARNIDALAVWKLAEDPKELHLAIAVRVIELCQQAGEPIGYFEVPRFFVGSEFMPSLFANQGIRDGAFSSVVLDTCARVVMGRPKSHIRDFLNGGAPSRRRADDASARRTHITGKGLALRLLFWETSGRVELANIGVKHELAIQEGSVQDRVG